MPARISGLSADARRTELLRAKDAEPTAWTGLSYAASWSDYGATWQPGRYRKIGDVVYLEGLAKHASAGVGTNVATLPVGFRPSYNHLFAVWAITTVNSHVVARLDVLSTGAVFLNTAGGYSGVVGYLQLDGVSFSTL